MTIDFICKKYIIFFRPELFHKLATRPKKALWLVSHCQTLSKRENFAIELARHYPVDIRGYCTDVSCE